MTAPGTNDSPFPDSPVLPQIQEEIVRADDRQAVERSLQLFLMACYDLDRFRAFVASEGLSSLFDLPTDEMRMILTDDAALMLFGFRFLRQTLFGEATIPVHAAADERRARQQEKLRRLERDAAERMARAEGGEIDLD